MFTYDPIVKKRINNLIIKKDCKELQNEFNIATDRMDVKLAQGESASRELEMISFLEKKIRVICHKK